MKKNDYKNYDTLTMLVKKDKVEDIIEYYKKFGWELVENNENKKYEDIVDLIFKRPHKIENKDELQLQQVYMEERLNDLGKLERHKHSKTTAFCLFFGVLGLVVLLCGIYLVVQAFLNLPLAIGAISIGFVFIITTIIFAPKIYKKEKMIFQKKTDIIEDELKGICDKVSSLLGGEYENL